MINYHIDKYSKVPLYHQLIENILESIRLGKLKPGDFLPPEEEICQLTGTSRGTVRQAINSLVDKGHVIRERGKGTQIKPPTLNHDLVGDFSFANGIKKIGLVPSTKVLSTEVIPGRNGVTGRLALAKKEMVFKMKRIRCADNEPWLYETTYISEEKFPGIHEFDFEANLLIDIL